MNVRICLVAAVVAFAPLLTLAADSTGTLVVHVDKKAAKIGPLFYGLMTEEINHSYDGGLYAEMIQNRIFQDNAKTPAHWSVVSSNGATGTITLDADKPVNESALKTSLRLDISAVGQAQRVGAANDGYWGIPVSPNTKYHASFYARSGNGFTGPLTVAIEPNDGSSPAALQTVPAVTGEWKKYEVDLTTGNVATSTTNQFVMSAGTKGSVWLSLVSLFPPTYNNRPNGNRVDLMQKLADLHPKFLRFPGGNFLEGDHIPDRFNWKQTIGPLEDRPGHAGCWKYRASDGLGLLEFLDWCEDLHMEPLLAVYAGYSLRGDHAAAGSEMQPFVQEALDEIEYCTGDVSTTWGARRAKDGHPDPFVIHYVEIGNEDTYDKSKTYEARFSQIFDGINAKYPAIQCISTMPVTSRRADLVDDHAYPSPRRMLQSVDRYKSRDPNKPKVFFGEWATQNGTPTPTMRAALADAAWLTGLQRDSETVLMNCYAPLLVNVNKGGWQWPTNLIGYDAGASFGSPSYHAQKMFSANWGEINLATDLDPQKTLQTATPPPRGGIGVGTFLAAAEFKDVTVKSGDNTLYQSDFATGPLPRSWRSIGNGNWSVQDGSLKQSDQQRRNVWLTTGDANWGDYTMSVKARKAGGAEGFLLFAHVQDRDNLIRINIGGWGNTRSGLERIDDQTLSEFGTSEPFKVESGRWYDIRLEVTGQTVNCYVDDKLIAHGIDLPSSTPPQVFAVASSDANSDVIIKVVNAGAIPQRLSIDLAGATSVNPVADLEVLQGQPNDVNTIADPAHISPVPSKLDGISSQFEHEFSPYSVNVLRIHDVKG